MTRTAADVLDHHLQALNAGDLDGVVSDYANTAVLILPETTFAGTARIRDAFAEIDHRYPGARFTPESVTEALGVLLLEWTMESETANVTDGVDTFVIREGLIHAQTARFTPVSL